MLSCLFRGVKEVQGSRAFVGCRVRWSSAWREERLVVSILGPPNAGKSTLFNRLMCKEANKSYRLASDKNPRRKLKSQGRIGGPKKMARQAGQAIVSSVPGTTRDRRECIGRIGNVTFTLVDTAGVDAQRLLLSNKRSMERDMMQQTMKAVKQSDLVLLLSDARVGITADLAETCSWLRKAGTQHVAILANKLEGDSWAYPDSPVMEYLSQMARVGFGEPIPISAQHGEGLGDVAVLIQQLTREKNQPTSDQHDHPDINDQHHLAAAATDLEKPLQLAILGRQNVGKSTLVNSLLQQNRVITGPMPGLTRDAISIEWMWQDIHPVKLVDTAGIRRIAQRDDDIENLAVQDAMRAMKIADVAVLVLDAQAGVLQRQELVLADAVIREGRALVIAANKMDIVVDEDNGYTQQQFAKDVQTQLEIRLPMLRKTPVVAMSSLTGEGVQELMPVVFRARERWSRTISTGLLNRWLADVLDELPPPSVKGRRIKIKYILQTKGRPPTFLLFCNNNVDGGLPVPYVRYLTRHFQDTFEMYGMEVRMAIKMAAKDKNPFSGRVKKSIGIGGREGRKKRTISNLQKFGTPKQTRQSRKNTKHRYS